VVLRGNGHIEGQFRPYLREPNLRQLSDQAMKMMDDLNSRQHQSNFHTNDPRRIERLQYHNGEHVQAVVRRTQSLLDVAKEVGVPVTEEDIRVGILSAAFHDVVQKFESKTVEDPNNAHNVKRIRDRSKYNGVNEQESADAAIDAIRAKYPDLTAKDEATIRSTIQATQVYFDKDLGLVSKTADVDPTHPLLQHVISFADLGAAGMDGPAQYVEEGNRLFREEQFDIQDEVNRIAKDPSYYKKMPEARKNALKDRLVGWSKGQVGFAEMRRKDTMREIGELVKLAPPAKQANAQARFQDVLTKGFDGSINAAKEKLAQRQNMNIKQLLNDFGYHV